MESAGFALFDTPIGACGIAWGPGGLRGVQLPEANEATARARLRRRFPDLAEAAPPPAVAAIVAAIVGHLAGAEADYASVRLDFAGIGAFEAAVYEAARAIPRGTTSTYGAVAARLGDPLRAREVGQALGRNPWPIVVPCHRVTAADGRTGGFSAPGGAATKLALLGIEGALAAETLPLFAPPAAERR